MSKSNQSMNTSIQRQGSPQHNMCLPRNKPLHTTKAIVSQQQVQIPIYLNEAQLALINSKVSRPFNSSDPSKVTITTAKCGPNTTPSIMQQQQQLLTQHLQQQQSHNYFQQLTDGVHPTENSGASGNAVSYLIAPNLLLSHNQLSQLTPRDVAILQQKLLHQQHMYQHQQQMQASSTSSQHLTCTCPSELHRAMHAQQQQQRLLEQRKIQAAQLSAMHGGPQIKLVPAAANTLPRDLHSSTHHLHQSKSDGIPCGTSIGQGHLCQNHQLTLQREINIADNGVALPPVTSLADNTAKETHICSLNSSGDSGYSSNREQPSSEVDSQISNIITWIETVYGIKLVDYLSKTYSLQSQNDKRKCCEGTREINGNELLSSTDSQRMKANIKEIRSELDDLQMLVKRQKDFFKESFHQLSSFIQSQGSKHITERIKLFEYNQAVLAHKIQTVHTTLSSYLSSEEKYQPDVINNISRNVTDINNDYSKLQENYILIEKPVQCNIESSNENIDKHHNIMTMVNNAMLSSQGQLNTLNCTMTDLIRKQSQIRPRRRKAELPEEAMEAVVLLREELHRTIVAMTPDLEKRQSAYELLEKFLREKHEAPQISEAVDNFEDLVDANLSGVEDLTPTVEESPDFRDYSEISSSLIDDDDSLPPPPPIESAEDSPVPVNVTDHLSHIDMTSDSIPLIDETPSSESFDDVSFSAPLAIMLVNTNTLKKREATEEEAVIDFRPLPKSGTILKTSLSLKTPKTNKVVFCNTVTVEDGSETIRLNYPSEESDCEEVQGNVACSEEPGTLRKNPPPPPPRRTSSGADSAEADLNYENLDSFSSDMRHHLLHHNLVCVPKGPGAGPASAAHSAEAADKRRVEVAGTKMTKGRSGWGPSENDVWQRQTEYNTSTSWPGQTAPPGTKTGPKAAEARGKAEKPTKRK